MASYGSLPSLERPQGAKQRVGLLAAVGGLCAVAAIVALVTISDAQHHQTVLLQASETQALAAISKSDKLLAKPAPKARTPSADSLKKAAEAMEQEQEAKIQKAAKKLEAEKEQEKEVKIAASKLLARAEQAETAKKVEDKAEAQYEEAKKAALAEANAKIAKAKKAKELAEKAATSQKLGANNDPHLDMNPKQPFYHPQHDPFSDLDPPVYKKSTVQKLGANDDRFLDMNPPTVPTDQHDPFSDLDPPVYKKSKVTHLKGTASAKEADAQVDALEKQLRLAKQKAAAAEKRVMQHLAESNGEEEEEDSSDKEYVHPDPNYKPPLYEDYYPGKLGPMGESKRVPEDHAKGHKMCRFHDIDCDELWPWGKVKARESGPPERHGPLGDNLVGVFGQDDVVVPTKVSGLIARGHPYVDQFDHWPEDSKKNKDLLYGTARKMIAQKYTGVGDVYVPLERLEHMQNHKKSKGQPLADFLFGSWEQGFHKPHSHDIRKHINMFDQPFRQHWSVAEGKGHQVYSLHPHPNAYGGPVGLGLTKGDEPTDPEFQGMKEEWELGKDDEEGGGEEPAAEEEAAGEEAAGEEPAEEQPEENEEEFTPDQRNGFIGAEEEPKEEGAEEPKAE